MPRTLPWLAKAAEKTEAKASRSSSSPVPKRRRAESPEDLVDSDLNPISKAKPKHKELPRFNRTPSTSPPPAPPDVEYMRDGFHVDDQYMMVEDEFLETAKRYTQHIHHAEYVRLKKLAKSRGDDVLQQVKRGVDRTTEQGTGLKLKLEADERRRKLKKLTKDESSDEEDDFLQDPHLAGLMQGSQKSGKDLFGVIKTKSNTRAAAGFSQSPKNVERTRDALSHNRDDYKPVATSSKPAAALKTSIWSDDESSGLDAKPHQRTAAKNVGGNKVQEPDSRIITSKAENSSNAKKSDIFKRFAEKPSQESNSVFRGRSSISSEQKTSTPLPSSTEPPSRSNPASDYLAKKRAKERKAREDASKKKDAADDIPTFLF